MAKLESIKVDVTDVHQKARRDFFIGAALTGICSSPFVANAHSDPRVHSSVAMIAMAIGDATMHLVDHVDFPTEQKIVVDGAEGGSA